MISKAFDSLLPGFVVLSHLRLASRTRSVLSHIRKLDRFRFVVSLVPLSALLGSVTPISFTFRAYPYLQSHISTPRG